MTDTKQSADRPKGLMDEDGRLARTVVLEDSEASSRVRPAMLFMLGPAMLVLVACLVVVYAVPALEWARPWGPKDPALYWNLFGRPFEEAAADEKQGLSARVDRVAQEVLRAPAEPEIRAEPVREVVEVPQGDSLPAYVPHPDDSKVVEQPLELFKGDELDIFFEALARSDAGVEGSITRAVHWGDSSIGVDGIPSAIRRRMQARFGDAGHGFHVMAPPNTSYRHKGVKFSHNGEWDLCFMIRKCRSDGHYGLGGTISQSYGGGISSFAPDPKHSSGHVSRFEIWYATTPRGGRIRYRVDREDSVIFETRSQTLDDAWLTIDVEDGPHRLKVEALGGGKARIYGVVLERDGPGVVWDGLALVGAFTNRMLEFDGAHLSRQLGRRQPQLAVFTFGGNDMVRESMSMETYEAEYRDVIQHVRRARPEMSCLIMSPLDHGIRRGVRIVSLPVVEPMVEAQRRVAQSEGCAYFDTYRAMGGEGAAGRWFSQSPRLVSGDLSHVTYKGQVVIGEMFYRALMQAYIEYRGGARGEDDDVGAP